MTNLSLPKSTTPTTLRIVNLKEKDFHYGDLRCLEIQSHSLHTGSELNELLSLDIGKTVNSCDTISDGEDSSSLGKIGSKVRPLDSLLKD